jgi:antibiotic biosynthesis monooxygenase (ABM) superfamily enzyme
MKLQNKTSHQFHSVVKRILVGYLGLYPTLMVVLSVLNPFTRHLNFSTTVLIEVLVLVPITQIISYPVAGWLVARIKQMKL